MLIDLGSAAKITLFASDVGKVQDGLFQQPASAAPMSAAFRVSLPSTPERNRGEIMGTSKFAGSKLGQLGNSPKAAPHHAGALEGHRRTLSRTCWGPEWPTGQRPAGTKNLILRSHHDVATSRTGKRLQSGRSEPRRDRYQFDGHTSSVIRSPANTT